MPRGGWTRAREGILHTFSSISLCCYSTQFSIVYYNYSQMDYVLLLNSGGSVVQLDTMDSGSCQLTLNAHVYNVHASAH